MNERFQLLTFTLTDPDETAAVGALAAYMVMPASGTIIFMSASPQEDDAGATIDLNVVGGSSIAAVDASDKDVPGTWLTPGNGGTNTPVAFGAGDTITLDANSAAAGNLFYVNVGVLWGSSSE